MLTIAGRNKGTLDRLRVAAAHIESAIVETEPDGSGVKSGGRDRGVVLQRDPDHLSIQRRGQTAD